MTDPPVKLLSCCAIWKEMWYFPPHLVAFSFKPNTVVRHETHFKVRFWNYAGFKWKQFNFPLKWHPDFVPSCLWMNASSDSLTILNFFFFFYIYVHFPATYQILTQACGCIKISILGCPQVAQWRHCVLWKSLQCALILKMAPLSFDLCGL